MVDKRRWIAILLLILSACLFEPPSEDVAGTSVGTGNPGKIKIGFKQDGQPLTFSGHIYLFGRTQVPIPGFRPDPLAHFEVQNSSEFTLSAQEVASIPDSAWPKSSVSDNGQFSFNLVVDAESTGTLVQGLVFDSNSKEIFQDEDLDGNLIQRAAQIEISISRKKTLQVLIRPEEMAPNQFNYLFVRGTGYFALANNGLFNFPPLPDGSYLLYYISLPDPERIGGGTEKDSVYTYETSHPVSSIQIDTITFGDASEHYPIPDRYKNNSSDSL